MKFRVTKNADNGLDLEGPMDLEVPDGIAGLIDLCDELRYEMADGYGTPLEVGTTLHIERIE